MEGVIFSTYSALVSKSKDGTRKDQISKWLGGAAADGCIMFDESHKADRATSPPLAACDP